VWYLQRVTSTEVLPDVAVKLWPCPSLGVAASGMALITGECRLLAGLSPLGPFSLLRVSPRLRAIGEPSTPFPATGASVGASGLTETASVLVVGRQSVV